MFTMWIRESGFIQILRTMRHRSSGGSAEPRPPKGDTASERAVRIAPERSVADAHDEERKTVTALFADIKGSMDLMEELDPEAARALVDPALHLMIDSGEPLQRGTSCNPPVRNLRSVRCAGRARGSPRIGRYMQLSGPGAKWANIRSRFGVERRQSSPLRFASASNTGVGPSFVDPVLPTRIPSTHQSVTRRVSLGASCRPLAPTGSIAIHRGNCGSFTAGYFELKALGLDPRQGCE